MNLLAETIKRTVKAWNVRPLTEDDFWRLCKKNGVLAIEDDSDDMIRQGLYTVVEDVPVIFLHADLRGVERLWTMFHELGHHLLHTPETCFFSEHTYEKAQCEANIFTAIALIPKKVIQQMYLWDLYDVDEFAAKLFQIRLEVFEKYKM